MTDQQHPRNSLERPAGAHEESDIRAAPVAIFLVSLAVLVFAAFLVVAWLFSFFESREQARYVPRVGVAVDPELPPEPRLQPSPVQDLRQLRAAEEAVLHNYGWVNKQGGIVRIPVDRAMELVLERGLPEVPAQQPVSPGQAGTPQEIPGATQPVPDVGPQPSPGDVQPVTPGEETNRTPPLPEGENR
jgi:hypothetical protein